MTISADLSKMDGRWDPDPEPRFIDALARNWLMRRRSEDERPLAVPEAGNYRASMTSARCDRALWWELHDEPVSNPASVADIWRMELGKIVHDALAAELESSVGSKAGHRVQSEVTIDLRKIGIAGSMHADNIILVTEPETGATSLISLELKTINGFSFKRKAYGYQRSVPGPSYAHVVQACLAGHALDCDEAIVGYLSLENVSVSEARRMKLSEVQRFAATWTIDGEAMRAIAELERQRILAVRLQDMVPAPIVHDPEVFTVGLPDVRTVIEPPASGSVITYARTSEGDEGSPKPNTSWIEVNRTSTWFCDYCPRLDACKRFTSTGSTEAVEVRL